MRSWLVARACRQVNQDWKTLETGIIFDIEKFAIHDGPGIRTTVFFKGCPLNCWWCHNPESQAREQQRWFWERRCIRCQACVKVCPQGAISLLDDLIVTDDTLCLVCGDCAQVCQTEARQIIGRQVTVAQVMAEIEKDVIFYDQSGGGVTFSGGEPLMQPDFLYALLASCEEKEIHTVVDTSGLAAWKTLQRISSKVDLFLYDLKVMDSERHRRYTGVSNEVILSNLRALALQGSQIAVRMPLIPGVNDDDENLSQMCEFVASLAHPPSVSLLPYHKAGIDKYAHLRRTCALPDTEPPSDERVEEIKATLQRFGLDVKLGG
jgi:pyruvate formate lyase activating enzyme